MGGDNNDTADFTGLFTIQKQYLADLSAISKTDTNSINYYQALSTKLNDLYNTYNSTNPASSVALDHQNKMRNIIETEKTRLEQKKTGIDNAYSTQQRLIQLNESYREKNMQYINILIIAIITIVIYLALLLINRNLSFIPDTIINVLIALLFSISFIIICIMILQVNKRDHMDYHKLLFVPPDTSGNIYGNVYGNVSMTGIMGCINGDCCGTGTVWNSTYGNCIATGGATSGFTLIGQVCGNNNCKKCGGDSVKYLPYTPYEFDSYVKI